jgi:hypothetical protein
MMFDGLPSHGADRVVPTETLGFHPPGWLYKPRLTAFLVTAATLAGLRIEVDSSRAF